MPILVKATLKCDTGMDFPIVEAEDISVDDSGNRLSDTLKKLPVYKTQEEYEALEAEGSVDPETPYFIIQE